jgi:hypothetical protein
VCWHHALELINLSKQSIYLIGGGVYEMRSVSMGVCSEHLA